MFGFAQSSAPADPRTAVESRLRSGANWFRWIAALSVVNSVIALFSGQWTFIFGLGITQVFDGLGQGLADGAEGGAWGVRLAMLALSVGAAGFYALFGWLAARRKTVGFAAGMACYSVDGLIFLLAGDFLGLAFHAFALVGMGRGFGALRTLAQLDREAAATPRPTRVARPEAAAVAGLVAEVAAEQEEPAGTAR